MSGATVVRATALVKDYGGDAPPALGGVDVELAAGTFTSVMGPSGSGKSTLLHLLGGMDRPSGGEVEIDGRSLATLDDDALSLLRRDAIGFVFQSYNLVPVLTAGENVSLPAVIAGRKPAEGSARLDEVLELVGLTEHRSKLPSQMSGGQQQRVAIARALFNAPKVVLADEPTGNLDSTTGAEVLDLLRRIVDESGTTILMVTHDPRAAAMSDEVVLLRDGRIAGRLPLSHQHPLEARASQLTAWLADPTAPVVDLTELEKPPVAAPRRRRTRALAKEA
jgi:putative ABC transport system ATP-binding protein